MVDRAADRGASGSIRTLLAAAGGCKDTPKARPVSPGVIRDTPSVLRGTIGAECTLRMAEQYCESRVPGPGSPGDSETAVRGAAERALRDHDAAASALRFSDALGAIFSLVDAANKHYQRTQPWQLAKASADRPALEAALYAGLEAVRLTAYMLFPYMPSIADRVTDQLGVSAASTSRWSDVARWGVLTQGTAVRVGAPLFPRLERDKP